MRSFVASVLMAAVIVALLVSGCASSYGGQAQTQPIATPVVTAPPGSAPGTGQNVQMTLTAANIAFDKNTLTAPAGSHVTMTFVNNDGGVAHNFALYTDSSAATKIYVGAIFNGVNTMTYTFDAPATPGTYFFRCDVHPTVMFGTFVVT